MLMHLNIAKKITSNIRELEGAIKMIMSYHNLMNKSILLGAFFLCLSLTSKAQIYRNGADMYIYPTTSSQI